MSARLSASTPRERAWPTGARCRASATSAAGPRWWTGVDERLEVHLFDFDEDLYGQTLEVELTDLVRGDRKFDTLDAMVAQMQLDAAQARHLLMPAVLGPSPAPQR